MCADGASTNIGKLHGTMTVIKQDISCCLHKLELVVKDIFKTIKDSEDIDSSMGWLFRTFKDSGKYWWVLLLLASKMSVSLSVCHFVKSHSIRFQAPRGRMLLMSSSTISAHCCCLQIMQPRQSVSSPVEWNVGFHKKWTQYDYPILMCFYNTIRVCNFKALSDYWKR